MKDNYSKELRYKYSTLIFPIICDVLLILSTGFFVGYMGYFISVKNNGAIAIVTAVCLALFSVMLIAFLCNIQTLIRDIKQYKNFDPVKYLEELKREDEAKDYCLINKDF